LDEGKLFFIETDFWELADEGLAEIRDQDASAVGNVIYIL
jgi:hypothetical protein